MKPLTLVLVAAGIYIAYRYVASRPTTPGGSVGAFIADPVGFLGWAPPK